MIHHLLFISPWWLLIFLAVFLIGITKSGFGSGVGLMIVPMTVVAMGRGRLVDNAAMALGFVLPLLIIGDLIAIRQYRKLFDMKIVRRLMPGTIVGILIGGALLWYFHHHYSHDARPGGRHLGILSSFIKIEVGFESVILVGLHWYRTWRAGANLKFHPSVIRSSAVGAFAGASSTLAHAAGPIIALHLLPQRLDRQIFVGTCALYFFIVNTSKVPIYIASGQFRLDTLWLSAKMLPLVFIGAGVGFLVTKRINDQLFSKIVYALTFCLGWYLLYDGIKTVLHQ